MTNQLRKKISNYSDGKCGIDDVFSQYLKDRGRGRRMTHMTMHEDFTDENMFTLPVNIKTEKEFDKFFERTIAFSQESPYMRLNWKSEVMDRLLFVVPSKGILRYIKEKFNFRYNTCPLKVMVKGG